MAFNQEKGYDVESAQKTSSQDIVVDAGAVHAESLREGDTWYAKAHRMAGRFGVESRGIERVPSDERTDASMSQIGTMVWTFYNF
jgi:hypothetical protein